MKTLFLFLMLLVCCDSYSQNEEEKQYRNISIIIVMNGKILQEYSNLTLITRNHMTNICDSIKAIYFPGNVKISVEDYNKLCLSDTISISCNCVSLPLKKWSIKCPMNFYGFSHMIISIYSFYQNKEICFDYGYIVRYQNEPPRVTSEYPRKKKRFYKHFMRYIDDCENGLPYYHHKHLKI